MSIVHITKGQEQIDELLRQGKFVLLDHMTTWCGPCKQLMRYLKTIAADFPEVIFASVDLEASKENEEYATSQEQIQGVPHVYFFDPNGLLIEEDAPIDKEIRDMLDYWVEQYAVSTQEPQTPKRH